jgi:exopolysaccharide biosynthesis WecB/TagA/CpsF family protein
MLTELLNVILIIGAAFLLLPVLVFCVQCTAALLPRRRRAADPANAARRLRVAVIMPAHNEALGIGEAIDAIRPQLGEGDRLLVVADNCDDDTAAISEARGAEVVVRHDAGRRGKGYALDFGLRRLELDAPDVVIVLDSDCIADQNMVSALIEQVAATNRPAQAIYLMERPTDPKPRDTVSALAFLVKNLVRPRGLARLGLPCLLTGTGMAFPWQVIRRAELASGNIVEDMQLSIDLTLAGHAPLLCADARVSGRLPRAGQAAKQQRTRWEHGHMQTAARNLPRLIAAGLARLNHEVLSVALDLSVPPLSLLVGALTAATALAAGAMFAGAHWMTPAALACGLSAVAGCVMLAWARFGRDSLPATALLASPLYLAGKLPIYLAYPFHRERQWIRTDRRPANGAQDVRRFGRDEMPATTIEPVRFHAITEAECVAHVMDALDCNDGGFVVTPNLDHLRRARSDGDYAGLIAGADLVVADGMPIIWASRLRGEPLPQRVAGSDLISSLSAAAAERGRKIFLLGGAPGAAGGAAAVLSAKYPELTAAGHYCPPVGFENDPAEMSVVVDALKAQQPDIVFVGLGSPKQERLIEAVAAELPRAWWLGVGYSFSFLAGDGRRAPVWMRKTGLEWAHRLAMEPQRLARRYLVEGVPFATQLLGEALVEGTRRRLGRPAKVRSPLPEAHLPTNVDLLSHAATAARNASAPVAIMTAGSDWLWKGIDTGRPPVRDDESLTNADGQDFGGSLRSLRAFVLLGGELRPTPFRAAIDRSILDMPLENGRSILAEWQRQTGELAQSAGLDSLALRVLIDGQSPMPAAPAPTPGCVVTIERDPYGYRGSGGILRDLIDQYADDDLLLVASGAQVLLAPLEALVGQLLEAGGEVSFISHTDGTPSGLMLIRCRALRMISETGYIDLKEQALPAIARQFEVTHVEHRRPTGLAIRSMEEYLATLKFRHRQADMSTARRPDHHSGFTVIESGASIDPAARLCDCVILKDARVEGDAVVVRSVVGPGAVIKADHTAVDQFVHATEGRVNL